MPVELDFANHGQEEVYVPLHGSVTLIAGGRRWALARGVAVMVGPAELRWIVTGDEPFPMLALGGRPGLPYEPPTFTGVGDPEPATPF